MWRRPPEPGSARSWRQRERLDARLAGRGDPTVQELAPLLGAVLLALVVGGFLLTEARQLGGWPLATITGLAYLALLVRLVLWRGAVVRRRRGRYTEAEAARLRHAQLPAVAMTLLRRDRIDAVLTDWEGEPRILGVDVDLDLTFAQPQPEPDTSSGLRPGLRSAEAVRPVGAVPLRVVVSLGKFSRADVVWAANQPGLHLVDGLALQRWATGVPLLQLLGVGPVRTNPLRRSAG